MSDLLVVSVFGKESLALESEENPPDFEAKKIICKCHTTDDGLMAILDEDSPGFIVSFGNEEDYTSGITAPVSVFYSDDSSIENHFELRLFVYDKVEDGFGYVEYGSLFFEDDSEILYKTPLASRNLQYDEVIEHGNDNIYEFVIGNCNSELADFYFEH